MSPRGVIVERIAQQLPQLPARQRQAFLLARFEGFTTQQIAENLRCTIPEAHAALVAAIDGLKVAAFPGEPS